MNLRISRGLFVLVVISLIFLVAFPAIIIFVPLENRVETFSEFILLDQNHDIITSPINLSSQEITELYVSLKNHMSRSEYYNVEVKFRNSSLASVENNISGPSSASILYSYSFVLDSDETFEVPLTIGFSEANVASDILTVNNFIINNNLIPIRESIQADIQTNNFVSQLLFELWMYDEVSDSFEFVGQKTWAWINLIS